MAKVKKDHFQIWSIHVPNSSIHLAIFVTLDDIYVFQKAVMYQH